jgi:hypothetical protein
MKHRPLFPVLVCCLSVLIAALPSHSGDPGGESITAKVPFPFTAGDRALPVGSYKIEGGATPSSALRISSADGKTTVPLLVVTRLARQHMGDAPKASLVFDVVGDRYFLSEVWLPGQDGFLTRVTEEKHTHAIVEVNG